VTAKQPSRYLTFIGGRTEKWSYTDLDNFWYTGARNTNRDNITKQG
jgi:hypothetical protein